MVGETINNYVIERKIGAGGMGVVYYARHNRVEREVAIKVLHNYLFTNETIRNRFKNEATALIKLNHPNIVSIYDYVEQDDFACLIMEYINGYTIDEYIGKVTGPIPAAKAIYIMAAVLSAVQYAHDQHIYHRDIKPGNIMVDRSGNMVKIMDFGVAKLADQSNLRTTHAHSQIGTPFYMSPEQIQGMPLTLLSDIYQLGITLYEMVTGKFPFMDITNLYDLQNKIVKESLPPTSMYYPDVPELIQNAIIKATSKVPEQRFQSCDEFRQFLLGDNTKPAAEPAQAPADITDLNATRPGILEIKPSLSQPEVAVPSATKRVRKKLKFLWWIFAPIGIAAVATFIYYFWPEAPKVNYSGLADSLILRKETLLNSTLKSDSIRRILIRELNGPLKKQDAQIFDRIDTTGEISLIFSKYRTYFIPLLVETPDSVILKRIDSIISNHEKTARTTLMTGKYGALKDSLFLPVKKNLKDRIAVIINTCDCFKPVEPTMPDVQTIAANVKSELAGSILQGIYIDKKEQIDVFSIQTKPTTEKGTNRIYYEVSFDIKKTPTGKAKKQGRALVYYYLDQAKNKYVFYSIVQKVQK